MTSLALSRLAARGYAVISIGVICFQFALAAGLPWGEYAMGGAFPGQFPPALRVAALAQAAFLALTAAVLLARAGLALPRWQPASRWLAWGVVALSLLGVLLNLATPSAAERMIWAPVAVVQLGLSLLVARAGTAR